jgi:hypothetical protein
MTKEIDDRLRKLCGLMVKAAQRDHYKVVELTTQLKQLLELKVKQSKPQ